MDNDTIITDSPIGKRLSGSTNTKKALLFENKTIPLVAKITIGRDSVNDISIDNKLASRRHAVIQKIKNGFFICDLGSTNGTRVNGKKIEADKYVKLSPG
jgi:pSer/pThr/pTyr-binding forkhead associated (FHA) protein